MMAWPQKSELLFVLAILFDPHRVIETTRRTKGRVQPFGKSKIASEKRSVLQFTTLAIETIRIVGLYASPVAVWVEFLDQLCHGNRKLNVFCSNCLRGYSASEA
jgi:hypothetical protein